MTAPTNPIHRRRLSTVAALVAMALLLGSLFTASGPIEQAGAQTCPAGSILTVNGTCELDVGQAGVPNSCPEGQQPDELGLSCVPIPADEPQCPDGQVWYEAGAVCVEDTNPCPDGQELDEAGLFCVEGDVEAGQPAGCQDGYSLGADGVTCVADGPACASNEVVGDDGACVKSFQCSPGLVLAADLLSCISGNCPDGQLLSVDGKRCIAPDSTCPDGSPRPVGGSCLVVETVESDEGTKVIVRCDESDAFCQARVKECADARAAGDTRDASCEDPRASCDDGDEACAQANDRLVECATRPNGDDEDGASPSGDPCDDLCPRLHRLDGSGECVEYLDPRHPCVSFGQVPPGVVTNAQLDNYSYLAGTSQCVTKAEFLRRLGNFEAAAGAEAEALALLRETTSQYLTVEEQIADLDAALTAAEAEITSYTEAAALADATRAQNEKDLQEARKLLQREIRLLEAEVLEVYVNGGPDAALGAAILSAENITEIGIARSYGRALLDDQIDNIDRIRDLERSTVELGLELDEAVAEVNASLAAATATSNDIESLIAESQRLRDEQLERRDDEAELVAQLRDEKGQFAQELGIFDQASREIADIISESEFLVTEFEDFDGLLAKPVIPADVVSGFGPRLHPILGYVRNHDGLDFDASFGDPIYASAPGIVQIASSFGGYGETVVLDHGGGLLTLYAHMSVIGAEVGAEVKRGDVIGFIGSTGLSTGPHLHFEVWVEGRTAVDPLPYLTDLD